MRNRLLLAMLTVIAGLCTGPLLRAQTDIGLSVYGAFSGRTDANGYTISPANSAGGIFELRHLANPILGFEGTYSFNHADQTLNCGTNCVADVKANAHEVTLDWVPSVKVLGIRPFGVLGVGGLFDVGQSTNTSDHPKNDFKAVYVYGAGLDWPVIPHFGLRFQYRGNLYKAPNVIQDFSSADKFTHTAEPMVGIYFRL